VPRLEKNKWYEQYGKHQWDLWLVAIVVGHLYEIEGHFVYIPKSPNFDRRVFHSYEEAHWHLVENNPNEK
jgi:hypothetical protein